MANIGILNLPQTDTVVGSDLFIVQQNNVTKQISFDNLLFGLDNASFSSTISAHSTEISFLSTSLYTLSAQNTVEYDYLTNLITTQINLAFTNLSLALYPISSIKCTSDNVNPGFYIKNTIWKLVGQGQYMAGAGHTYQNGSPYTNGDKNRDKIGTKFYSAGNWYFLHYNKDETKLVIHTRPLSANVNNELLKDLAEIIRKHLNERKHSH